MAKTEPEIHRGAVTVRRQLVTRGSTRGYLVSWRSALGPQAIALPTDILATAIADRIAAGQNPITVLTEELAAKKRRKFAAAGGRSAWANMTPEERSAELSRRAHKRWKSGAYADEARPAAE